MRPFGATMSVKRIGSKGNLMLKWLKSLMMDLPMSFGSVATLVAYSHPMMVVSICFPNPMIAYRNFG